MNQWKEQKNIHHLDLSYCVFVSDQAFISYIKQHGAQLQEINISNTLLTDQSLLHMTYMNSKQLRIINISYCVNFSEGAIVNLLNSKACSLIEEIDLSGNQLSDVCLKYVFQSNKMPHIGIIKLNDIRKGQQGFSFTVFESLAQTTLNKSLLSLSLANSFVSKEQQDSRLDKPSKLYHTIFTKLIKQDHTFFYQLSLKSTQITHLILNRCELLTNKFIKFLTTNIVFMSSIKYLDLGHCRQLTDKVLQYLSQASLPAIQQLQSLLLTGLQITQYGIDHLTKSKFLNLKNISFSMCPNIQGTQIRSLFDSPIGKGLQSIELSGSHQYQQITGLFSNDYIVWNDNLLKYVNIELFNDLNDYYMNLSTEQKQYLNQNTAALDSSYKSFSSLYLFTIIKQLVLVKKHKVVFKIPYQDEKLYLKFILNFIQQNDLVETLQLQENSIFINSNCVVTEMLKDMCDFNVTTVDAQLSTDENIIQNNYITPIELGQIKVQKIHNLILIRQNGLTNQDLSLIDQYSNSIFSELVFLSIKGNYIINKGCKQITSIKHLTTGFRSRIKNLDIRKTQIQEGFEKIIQLFPNLTQLNNNKLEFNVTKLHKIDDINRLYKILSQMESIKALKITNKKYIFIIFSKFYNISLLILDNLTSIIKMSITSIKNLNLELYFTQASLLNDQEECIIQNFSQSLLSCIHIKSVHLAFHNSVAIQSLNLIYNGLLESNIKILHLDFLTCQVSDHLIFQNMVSNQQLQNVTIKCKNYAQINSLLNFCTNISTLSMTVESMQFLNSNHLTTLSTALQNQKQSLSALILNFHNCDSACLHDFIGSLYEIHLNSFELNMENSSVNEDFLVKLQGLILSYSKLSKLQLNFIGCNIPLAIMELLWKGCIKIQNIPDLKIYF